MATSKTKFAADEVVEVVESHAVGLPSNPYGEIFLAGTRLRGNHPAVLMNPQFFAPSGTPHDEIGNQLRELHATAEARAAEHGLTVDFRQSNHEGELVDWIQEARTSHAGILINPAAYSHTSVAIRDALSAVVRPIVEVHISNIHRREPFRHHSHVSAVADAVIAGAGVLGYELGVDWLAAAVRR